MRSESEADRTADIRIEERDGVHVIHLSGHISDLAADAVSTELDGILESGCTYIIFDLNDVNFMGSSGLGQIMRAYRAQKDKDGYVRLVNPQPLIADLLHLTKLDKLFDIYPTIEAAMADEDAREVGEV